MAEQKMARGIVAKGRTVVAPTSERRVVGYDSDGKPVYRAIDKSYAPGEEVTLSEAEIKHLRRAGYLVDPDAPPVAASVGPKFER